MACPVILKDLFNFEDGNGHFYLMGAPDGYDNTLAVSVGGAYTGFTVFPHDVDPAQSLIPGGYEAIIDLSGEATGEYVFRYVTPAEKEMVATTPDDCEDSCVDCEDATVTKITAGEDQEFVFCYQDTDTYNIFTLSGVDGSDYLINYAPGSPQDPDFDLFPGSPDYGDFTPNDITVGTYEFVLTYTGAASGCSDCDFNVTIVIEDPHQPGDDGEASICTS